MRDSWMPSGIVRGVFRSVEDNALGISVSGVRAGYAAETEGKMGWEVVMFAFREYMRNPGAEEIRTVRVLR